MNMRRRLVGLLFAALATTVVALAPGGPTYAGIGQKPPSCGTPNTPKCVNM
jgi:hypothetical protein